MASISSQLVGEGYIQYGTMMKPRAIYSKCCESSPTGVAQGSPFAKGMNKATFASRPSQSETFSQFHIGKEPLHF